MKYLFVFLILASTSHALAFDHSHSSWTTLLKTHVQMSKDKTSSKVDYKSFNKTELKTYLETLQKVSMKEFKTFKNNEQLAFLINAYNAQTIKLIVDKKPKNSIKDLGFLFMTPWKKEFFTLLGEKRSLDNLEHTLTRESKTLGTDARIHFAFNCASIGCPALLNEAWQASKIDSQLDQGAKSFLKDHSRNWIDLKNKRVMISNIFKWYAKDFETKNYTSLKDFLVKHANSLARNEKEKALLLSQKFKISFSGYNWNLNKL